MKSAHVKRHVMKSFPVRRMDTITRANIAHVLIVAEKPPTTEVIVQRILGTEKNVDARHVRVAQERLRTMEKNGHALSTTEHGQRVWTFLHSAAA